jgi:phospholipid/cholesterol/gamma-HCH transport system substrate-binding protein
MEAEARYTWVGAAMLGLLAALLGSLLWLRNVGSQDRFNHYAIHFEQQALDGLELGAAVNLRGIRIGRVEDYDLPGRNGVRVAIRVDRRAPVYTDTAAVVTRNLITGIASITLVSADPPGELLAAVPEGETLPVIGEGRSDLQEIAGRVNKVGEMASVAIENLNQLLDAGNRETFISTLRKLGDLAAGLNQRLASLDSTLARVGRAADAIGQAARTVGGTASEMGQAASVLAGNSARLASVAEAGGQRLDTTLTETDRAIAEARHAFARIAEASETLQQQARLSANRIEQSTAHIDEQLSAAVSELRLGVETGTRVLDRLREPRAALLGPGPAQLGPGEKTP